MTLASSLPAHFDNIVAAATLEAANERHSAVNAFEEGGRSHGASQGNVPAGVGQHEQAVFELNRADVITQVDSGLNQRITPTGLSEPGAVGGAFLAAVNAVNALNSGLRPTDSWRAPNSGRAA